MTIHDTIDTLNAIPDTATLWSGAYKIPWNDPAFSRRMLREHLTQDHDLASRREETIAAQARWLHARVQDSGPASILDLGCGPGLYAPHLAQFGHSYLGVDFGPASIEYATANNQHPDRCRFVLGDVLDADLQGQHDMVAMLYGEINVFPPEDSARLLKRACDALAPGGSIVIEAHTVEAVKRNGQGRSWYAVPGGLFSDGPHICLTVGHYFPDEGTSVQCFHVFEDGANDPTTYRSTTKAWSLDGYRDLLTRAGFSAVELHDDWPGGQDALVLITAVK